MDRTQAERLLHAAVGRSDATFRDGQWEAIDALANDRARLLVVERTGWGKSSVYFIATRILRDQGSGPTLIVSPLLALMRNQIDAAERLRIRAATINSSNRDAWDSVKQRILADRVDALLISPERLSNESFVETVLMPIAGRIGLLVVDEVHCISDWGHDFRPDYQRLINVLRQLPPNLPVLGTTATASNRVIADVSRQLGDIRVQRGPLVRDSLSLQTLSLPGQASRLAWLAQRVPELPGTGIVYTLTTSDARQVAGWLSQQGIDAKAYYSNVEGEGFEDSSTYRQHLEDQLLGNELKALVATTALGMGYDKPDVGFVIHYQVPGSIVGYYQQVGRAGRAVDRAFGVLLSGREDGQIVEHFRTTAFPPEADVEKILGALEDSDGLSVRELQAQVNLRQGQVQKVLKILSVESPAPVLKRKTKWQRTPVRYAMDTERIRRLTGQRELEWREIQDYVRTDGCLMAYLRRALDDPESPDCGRCANCLGRPVVDATVDRGLTASAARFLRRAERAFSPNKQVHQDAFPQYGFRGNLRPEVRSSDGRTLSAWKDAGWGAMVAKHRLAGRYGDELVAATAEMIRERWRPSPKPEWVTCVPSLRNPDLVPDFAKRLAGRIGLPFRAAVRKIADNEPQREQRNSFHQCRNLDGAFGISDRIRATPVLLVDDLVGSGWTLTIVAALLRRAGSGPVHPVALASIVR